ncbi:MAG: hypothetical protein ACI80P_001422 [Flavobacteriales bacterium]|jgi:hypothetical protein
MVNYFFALAIFPPNQAIGIYANTRSVTMNHVGAGMYVAAAIPPRRNTTPMLIANFILCVAAMVAHINAPSKAPKAWARNGMIKCFGSNKGKAACKPSAVVKSVPSGGGIMDPLIEIIHPLITVPITIPRRTARTFLRMGFMFERCKMVSSKSLIACCVAK